MMWSRLVSLSVLFLGLEISPAVRHGAIGHCHLTQYAYSRRGAGTSVRTDTS